MPGRGKMKLDRFGAQRMAGGEVDDVAGNEVARRR
jgi:hypothetical protein